MSTTFPSHQERLRAFLKAFFQDAGYRLAYMVTSAHQGTPKLHVAFEYPDGTAPSLDLCVRFHKQLRLLLTQEELFTDTLSLEVSSPGLDRPLFDVADFKRFQGRDVHLVLKAPIEGKKRFNARLDKVDDTSIRAVVHHQPLEVDIQNIHHCKLIPIL